MILNKTHFTKPELFNVYFLALRSFYIYSLIMCLVLGFQVFGLFSGFLTMTGVITIIFQFYLSLHAEKLILAKNYWGTLFGLGLGLFIFVGFGLPVACLGFFALLNKSYREKYVPADIPAWLNDGFIKLDTVLKN